MNRDERGFSLLETLVAAAISVVLGYVLILAASSFLHWSAQQAKRDAEHAAIGELVDRWEAEEDSAWAIFTPPADVLGANNADGHEVDFFTRDGKNRAYFWAYDYDAQAQTLVRYRYGAPGAAPVKDLTYAGITKFAAHTYPVTALQDANTPVYSPLYANAALRSGIVHFYPAMPWIAGGNAITWLHVEGETTARELQLVTQTAPTGFTIVLSYTPAPAATPKGVLAVWPPAVRYPVQGAQLANAARAPVGVASMLNAILGGGVANAAGCAAQAFTDSTYGTPIASGTQDPFGAGVVVTGPNGCYNGAIAVSEAGYGGVFQDFQPPTNPCSGSEIFSSSWTPYTRAGPTAFQTFSGGTMTTTGCNLGFTDANSVMQTSQAAAQVIDPCWEVGGSCAFRMTYLDGGGGGCDSGTGETWSGYDGNGRATISPISAGTWSTADRGATYSFTRTAPGIVSVTVESEYEKGVKGAKTSGGYKCSLIKSYSKTNSFTIPSV